MRRIANARYANVFWAQMAQDGRLRRRRYFEMKRGFNALLIVTTLLRRRDWNAAARELGTALKAGLIRPRMFLDYCVYALRLHRVSA